MAEMLLVNPRKRRRRKTTRKPVTRRRTYKRRVSTSAARKTRRRRNPIRRKGVGGMIQSTIMPAALAGAGAVGLDVIWGYLPVPDQLKTGPMRYVAKAAGAIGLGMLAAMVTKKSTADQLASGAMTVVMYQAMKDGMTRFAPNIPMGEYLSEYDSMGYYGSGMNPGEMGEYMSLTDQSGAGSGFGLGANDYETLTL